jgi:twinkle protein
MKDYSDYGIEIPFGRKSGHIKTFCPKCRDQRSNKRDRSLSVDLDRGIWKCHYCSFTGGLPRNNTSSLKYQKKEYTKPVLKGSALMSEKALAWFAGRGISMNTLTAMKVTEGKEWMPQKGKEVNTIQFNYYKDGELINTKFRTGDKCFKLVSNAELIPYNLDAIKGVNTAICTEGEIDTLSFIECGRTDVVSVPNGANANLSYLDDYLEEYFDDKEIIYIASDTDTKGVMLRQELIRRFGPERCKVVEYGEDCKDANEHLVKYGKESLLQCLDNAVEPKIEGVFAVEDVEKPLDLLYQKGLQRGYTIGFENFDELCSFERKRLCILTGIPSAGKSAWLNFIAVRLNMLYDWKFAFFSPESMPIDYHISTLIELITGKKFSKETLPLLEYEAAKEYANDNFFFIYPDSYTMGNILEKAKSLVRRKGIKALVIDPYNRVESEQDYRQSETQHISKVLDQLTNFAQQNDVLVFLMAHPTKMPKNPDGKFQVPTLYDISGSANFYNKADFGISVHRDKEFGWTEIHVQKVKYRHLGQGGMAKFKYNLFNSRYVPYEDNVPPNWDNSNYLAAKANSATMSSIFEPNTEFDDLPF